ncbi:BamA/TamA family outer membrane protein [Algoriphagus hitonicola]|uniref:Outer membrane protein assembly factor BamA n=1 Tax=Algoriphagus hitonicola TaxID=435880 RepID=A0A1I2SW65_9BACT|nr:BamA/TamA family outer membrane protein [Algoriphagus hitonicola]SFG56880.1 Outer membrane protein assembly factor BamA [Algoriphagus hitonicola]
MKNLLFVLILILGVKESVAQSTEALKFRVYLIGDAGEMKNGNHPVIDDLSQKLKNQSDIPNYLIYLGDNIYPLGLPKKSAENRAESELILKTQLDIFSQINEKVWMIPGNHDWEKGKSGGYEAILRAQAFVHENYPADRVQWIPADACPGPEWIKLDEETVLVIIDSQWWLHQNQKPGEDSDCEYKTEEEILAELSAGFQSNQDKTIILAMHHPMRAYGPHNGGYDWKDHLFPLRALNSKLYIPIPVLGSIFPLYRTWFGDIQDIPHPKYQAMIQSLDQLIKRHPHVIQVSGHEHGLFYTQEENAHYIVSGAGAKHTVIRKKNPAKFTYGNQGYAALDFYRDKKVKLSFISPEEEQLLYETWLDGNQNQTILSEVDTLPKARIQRSKPISLQYHKGKGHQFFFGKNYRATWALPQQFRSIDLLEEKGGLSITKRGGGMQTRSLRLENSEGEEFVLRSVNKYPENALSPILRKTIARQIVQDQISASHPYAAIAVANLAESLDIIHTNPEIVFLPDDPALGPYRKDFGGEVFLYEEREVTQPLADPEAKVISTDKMIKTVLKDNDDQVNQRAVLQARIFDLWIADWDRHDDQWRWVRSEGKNGWEFLPMPRDRDQAFFVNEGVFPKIASRKWANPKFQGFGYELKNVNGFMFNGRYFDRNFLNDLDRSDWKEELDEIIPKMTDQNILAAFSDWPASVRELDEREIAAKLMHRREWLEEKALEYYDFLAEEVDIPGSQKNDRFEIKHAEDGTIDVEIRKISKSGKIKQRYYNRTFKPDETREIRLYGLEGEDVFLLKGKGPGQIKVWIIPGIDPYVIQDEAQLQKKNQLIYQPKTSFTQKAAGPSSIYKKAINPAQLEYNRKEFTYDKVMPLASLEYNQDDGIFLGGGILWQKQGWKKSPYQTQQQIKANYAIRTGAFNIGYQGHAVDVLGNWDLTWSGDVRAPDYAFNFFGFGNESQFITKNETGAPSGELEDRSEQVRFYRTRFSWYEAKMGLQKKLAESGYFQMGPLVELFRFDADDNTDKFITSQESGIDQNLLLEPKTFGGLFAQLNYDKRDDDRLPSRGFLFHNEFKQRWAISKSASTITSLESSLALYWSFSYPAKITYATRFGYGKNWGNYGFFQGQTLGGMDNLRGYRRFRFNGDAVAYHNFDVRIQLFNLNTYLLPATVGLIGFHDIGRVWLQGESSDTWHRSAGAGIWLAPLNQFVTVFSVGFNKEETLPFFTFGYQF